MYRVVHRNCNNLVFKKPQIIGRLHGRVICHMNGNFVDFWEIFSKIVKNCPMELNLHFSGKWQNWQISQLLIIGKLEGIVFFMKVALVND